MKKKHSFYNSYYPFIRTIAFIIMGLFNTVLIKPEDIGTWKNYIGYLLLLLAVIDIVAFLVKKYKSM